MVHRGAHVKMHISISVRRGLFVRKFEDMNKYPHLYLHVARGGGYLTMLMRERLGEPICSSIRLYSQSAGRFICLSVINME